MFVLFPGHQIWKLWVGRTGQQQTKSACIQLSGKHMVSGIDIQQSTIVY